MGKLQSEQKNYKITEYNDLVYSQVRFKENINELHISLLVPETDKKNPTIMYFAGGGFIHNNYHKYIQIRLALAEAGFTVAGIEYSVLPNTFPQPIIDGKNAIKYLIKNADELNVDSNNISVMGDSAGGYLAQFLGTTQDSDAFMPDGMAVGDTKIKTVVSMYGISNLSTLETNNSPAGSESLFINGTGYNQVDAKTLKDDPQKSMESSPIFYVKEHLPSFLLMHGNKDTVVDMSQSQKMAEALQAKGNDAQFLEVDGAGHGTIEWFQPDTINTIVKWFKNKGVN